jgi:hypothetical protein
MKKRAFATLTLVFAMSMPLCAQGMSASAPGFAVMPLSMELSAGPGSRVSGSFSIVAHNTAQTTRYAVTVTDLGQTNAGGRSPVAMGQGARSCAAWVSVTDSVQLQPNGRQNVSFTVGVPAGARGSYHAFIVVELSPEMPRARFAALVKPSVAIQLDVVVPGPAPLHVDARELRLQPAAALGPADLLLTAANTGVWKSSVEGDVVLYPERGGFPIRTAIPYTRAGKPQELYPGCQLDFRCPLPSPLPPGRCRAIVRLLLNGQIRARNQFDLQVPAQPSEAGAAGKLLDKSELDLLLSIKPEVIEVTTPPGAHRTLPIRIRNESDREARISVDVAKVRVESNGMLTYEEFAAESDGGWVTVSPDSLTVAPRRSAVVRAQAVRPRENRGQAVLVRAVRIRAEADPTPGHDDWSSGAEYGVLIIAQDPNAAPASLEELSFDLIRTTPQSNPSAAVLRVVNSGGKLARAGGEMVLERESGAKIASLAIGAAAQRVLILPGDEREFRMALPPLDFGGFRVRAEVNPGHRAGQGVQAVETFKVTTRIPEGLRGIATPEE